MIIVLNVCRARLVRKYKKQYRACVLCCVLFCVCVLHFHRIGRVATLSLSLSLVRSPTRVSTIVSQGEGIFSFIVPDTAWVEVSYVHIF